MGGVRNPSHLGSTRTPDPPHPREGMYTRPLQLTNSSSDNTTIPLHMTRMRSSTAQLSASALPRASCIHAPATINASTGGKIAGKGEECRRGAGE